MLFMVVEDFPWSRGAFIALFSSRDFLASIYTLFIN